MATPTLKNEKIRSSMTVGHSEGKNMSGEKTDFIGVKRACFHVGVREDI